MHFSEIVFGADRYPTLEKYPFKLPVFQQTPRVGFDTPVTFFVGENGSGKSTLLEAIATKCNIHIWRTDQPGRVKPNPYEEALHYFISVSWSDGPVPGSFFSAEIFRDFSCNLEHWAVDDPGMLKYFGGASLLTQSHGQSLNAFFRARYKIKGLYLLDEPEAGLSPRSQLDLLKVIRQNSREGHAQFIIATHSPILLACPGARIYSFDEAPLKSIAYHDTEYYRLYRDFMAGPESFLERMFNEESQQSSLRRSAP